MMDNAPTPHAEAQNIQTDLTNHPEWFHAHIEVSKTMKKMIAQTIARTCSTVCYASLVVC